MVLHASLIKCRFLNQWPNFSNKHREASRKGTCSSMLTGPPHKLQLIFQQLTMTFVINACKYSNKQKYSESSTISIKKPFSNF